MELLTKHELALRWKISEKTVDEYRAAGIIKQVPKLPSVRFNLQHIEQLEQTTIERFSPLERKRLQQQISDLEDKLAIYEGMRISILKISAMIINL
jgi:hypothetical protein